MTSGSVALEETTNFFLNSNRMKKLVTCCVKLNSNPNFLSLETKSFSFGSKREVTSTTMRSPLSFVTRLASRKTSIKFCDINDKQNTHASSVDSFNGSDAMSAAVISS